MSNWGAQLRLLTKGASNCWRPRDFHKQWCVELGGVSAHPAETPQFNALYRLAGPEPPQSDVPLGATALRATAIGIAKLRIALCFLFEMSGLVCFSAIHAEHLVASFSQGINCIALRSDQPSEKV